MDTHRRELLNSGKWHRKEVNSETKSRQWLFAVKMNLASALSLQWHEMSHRLWKHFVDTAFNSGKYSSTRICECTFSVYYFLCLCCSVVYFYVSSMLLCFMCCFDVIISEWIDDDRLLVSSGAQHLLQGGAEKTGPPSHCKYSEIR